MSSHIYDEGQLEEPYPQRSPQVVREVVHVQLLQEDLLNSAVVAGTYVMTQI